MYKSLRGKAVLFAAILVIMAQLIFTLAQNAGFSLAQTIDTSLAPTPTLTTAPVSSVSNTSSATPSLNAWIDGISSYSASSDSPIVISGIKNAGATSPNYSFSGLTFYVINTSDSKNYASGVLSELAYPESGSMGKNWSGTLNADDLPAGVYYFYAKGYADGMTTATAYASNFVYFAVKNSTTAAPTPVSSSTAVPTPTPASTETSLTARPVIKINMPPSSGSTQGGLIKFGAISDLALKGLSFEIFASSSATAADYISHSIAAQNTDSTYKTWSTVFDTVKLPNGVYFIVAKGSYNGGYYKSAADYKINIYNTAAYPTPLYQPTISPYANATPFPMASKYPYPSFAPAMTPVVSPTSPSPLPGDMAPYISMPPDCVRQGFTTPEACQNYMMFPPECRSANILDPVKCKEFMFKFAMPEECIKQGATTQEECAKIMLSRILPEVCRIANITDEASCTKLMNVQNFLPLECRNANITAPEECGKYTMQANMMPKECTDAGVKTKEECDYIMRSKYSNFAENPALQMNTSFQPIIGGISPECKEKGITDPVECEKEMAAKYLPEDCKLANITTREGCEKFLFEKNAPKECISAKISTPEDCEKFMFKRNAPLDCVDAGMTSPEACKKFMFEKYGDKNNIPLDKFPVECKKAGATSVDECEKIMTQSYLPEDCKKNGVTDSDQCDAYLKQKYMPKDCQDAGAKTQKECDKVMFSKFAPDECKKAGIENEKECKDYMFNLYAPKMKCQSLDEWQCKNTMKENYLGNISAKQAEYAKVRDEIGALSGGGAVRAQVLREKLGDSREMIPIKDDSASVKIIKTEENLVLSEDNDLIQTAGAAIMVDSDDDGLTDDMEKRIGTDPLKPDSDKDGFKDGEEVKGGYNPLGEGNIEKEKIAPIDEAILNGRVLSHPKVAGIESDDLSFDRVSNVEAGKGDTDGAKYLFAGKAAGDSVVTLYVYSDLPIVVTAKTDKYGNWNYEFDKSLMDGDHEAYVVLSDKTGKVVTKSSVMNFFVNEAKAMSVKDFVSPASAAGTTPVKESEKSMNNYVLLTIGIIFAGLIIFIGFIFVLKKKNGAPKA